LQPYEAPSLLEKKFIGQSVQEAADGARLIEPKVPGGQLVHDDEPAADHVPAPQSAQKFAPRKSPNVPAGQGEHEGAPCCDVKPCGHWKHDVAPANEELPAPHCEQMAEPAVDVNVPLVQGTHWASTPRTLVKPAGQGSHEAATPMTATPVPAAQGATHKAIEVAPGNPVKSPTGQGVGGAEPAVQ
jgi:hypothetical protein